MRGFRPGTVARAERLRRSALQSFAVKGCWWLAVLAMYVGFGTGPVEGADARRPVVVNGDRVEYQTDQQRVIGLGHVVVTYGDVIMTCDRLVVFTETRDAYAEGHVRVSEGEQRLEAERMLYNFETRSGVALDAEAAVTGFASWYGRGEEARKLLSHELVVDRGYITSCDFDEPHYRIRARRIEIFLEDKVVARKVVFQVGRRSLFYLPYYSYSLKDDRPKVTVIPGKQKDWGFYTLTAARYELNQNAKGYIRNDYRERRGWAQGVDYLYHSDNWGDGKIRWYRVIERRRDRPQDQSGEAYRWRLQYRHKGYILDDEDTLATIEFHKQKDPLFLRDYYRREEFETDQNPLSYGSVVRSKPGYSLGLLVQPRANRFNSQLEYLPQLKWEVRNQPIWRWFAGGDTLDSHRLGLVESDGESAAGASSRFLNQWWKGFHYSGEDSLSVMTNEHASPTTQQENATRFDSLHQLSYPTRLAGWLSATPKVGVRQTWYDRSALGNERDLLRGQFSTGIDFSTKFYKIFDYTGEPLGMPINLLRHVITPTLGYEYAPKPTLPPERLTVFDGIDGLDRRHTVSIGLENKLQTKRMATVRTSREEKEYTKTDVERAMRLAPDTEGPKLFQSVDLARFLLSGGYSLKPEDGSRFTTVGADLELRPMDWCYFEADASYDPRTLDVQAANFDFYTLPNDVRRWQIGLGHRYEQNRTTQWTGEWTYFLSPKWKIRAYERFNWKRIKPTGRKRINELVEQEYTLTRDLHCWVAELNYNITRDFGESIWIIFRLKGFPDLPVELTTSYHQPKLGSQTNP